MSNKNLSMILANCESLDSGDKTRTSISLMKDKLALPGLGSQVLHYKNFWLLISAVIVEGGAAAALILTQFLSQVFSKPSLKIRQGGSLIDVYGDCKTYMESLYRLLALLVYQTVDDWDVAKSGTWTAQILFPIMPLNFPLIDRDDCEYVVAADAVELLSLAMATTVSGYTTTTFNWELLGEKVYLDERVISPVRKWREHVGTPNQGVVLPDAKYQLIAIVNPKGADANKYDLGISALSPEIEQSVVDGRVTNVMWKMFNTYGPNMADDDSAVLEDLFQIIAAPKATHATSEHYIRGPVKLVHNPSDPDIAPAMTLEVV